MGRRKLNVHCPFWNNASGSAVQLEKRGSSDSIFNHFLNNAGPGHYLEASKPWMGKYLGGWLYGLGHPVATRDHRLGKISSRTFLLSGELVGSGFIT